MHKKTIVAAVMAACALAVTPLLAQDKRAGVPHIDWTLNKTGVPLEREAVIVVSDTSGKPLTGAEIDIVLDMPSMPGAHRMPPVRAIPTAQPGSYSARFTLEMAGEWSARIEMKSPQLLKLSRKFRAD